jgi:hypothetical protein
MTLTPRLFGLLALTSLVSVPVGLMVVGWLPAALDLAHMPSNVAAASLLANSTAAAVGAWVVKYGVKRAPWLLRPVSILGGAIAMSLGLGVAGGIGGPAVYAGFLAAALLSGAILSALATLQQASFPDVLRNTLTASFNTVKGVVWAATTFLFGVTWHRLGLASALAWCAAATALLAVPVYSLIRRAPPRPRRSDVGLAADAEPLAPEHGMLVQPSAQGSGSRTGL